MSALVENEQRKLTATFLNGIAIAFFAIGGIAPLVGLFSQATHADWLTVAIVALIFMALSALIHRLARRTLEGLQP